jgi:hypothetical protein
MASVEIARGEKIGRRRLSARLAQTDYQPAANEQPVLFWFAAVHITGLLLMHCQTREKAGSQTTSILKIAGSRNPSAVRRFRRLTWQVICKMQNLSAICKMQIA